MRDDVVGNRYGKWTVKSVFEENRRIKARCVCECGREANISVYSLESGQLRQCKCNAEIDGRYKHGMAGSKLYTVWAAMKSRCYYKNNIDYGLYSGRGITVCDEWKDDFASFYNWAINSGYVDGLSIDRIDNNKGYSPDNCRWATPKEQANNRRSNLLFTYNGETLTLKQWAERFGIKYTTLYNRIVVRGKSFEAAIAM